jgi:hypothetical protein
MPGSDEESYRGWSIKFDITCKFETNLWSARAAVISPSEASDLRASTQFRRVMTLQLRTKLGSTSLDKLGDG